MEKEIKNRFKDQQSLEGIDSNQLWSSIATELDNKLPPTPPNRSNKLIYLLVLLLLVLGGFWICKSGTQSPLNQKVAQNELEANKKAPSNKAKISSLQNDSEKIQNELTVPLKNTIPKTKASAIPVEKSTLNAVISTPTALYSHPQQVDSKSIKSTKNKPPLKVLQTEKSTNKQRLTFINVLPTLLPTFLEIKNKEIDSKISPLKKRNTKNPNRSKEIAFLSGLNYSAHHFQNNEMSSTYSQTLNNTHQAEIGYTAGVQISWFLNEKFSINSGLNYDLIRSKFEHQEIKETIVFRENYITGFDFDPVTGDTINIVKETVPLNAQNTRTVVHHNRFHLLSIPLEIGIRQRKGKFEFGLNIGISPSLFIYQKGKSLNQQEEIQTINNNSKRDRPISLVSIAYQANPFIDYELTELLNVRLSPSFRFHQLGKSDFYGLNQRSIYTNIRAGIVLKLK